MIKRGAINGQLIFEFEFYFSYLTFINRAEYNFLKLGFLTLDGTISTKLFNNFDYSTELRVRK